MPKRLLRKLKVTEPEISSPTSTREGHIRFHTNVGLTEVLEDGQQQQGIGMELGQG